MSFESTALRITSSFELCNGELTSENTNDAHMNNIYNSMYHNTTNAMSSMDYNQRFDSNPKAAIDEDAFVEHDMDDDGCGEEDDDEDDDDEMDGDVDDDHGINSRHIHNISKINTVLSEYSVNASQSATYSVLTSSSTFAYNQLNHDSSKS
jgi:hypothetical protein